MKVFRVCLLFGLVALLGHCSLSSLGSPADSSDPGSADLRRHNFDAGGPVRLDGNWHFCWRNAPDANHSPPPLCANPIYVRVPGNWTGYQRPDGGRFPSFGYATFHLRLELGEQPRRLSFKLKDAATAYRMWVDGRQVAENGNPAPDAANARPAYRPLITETMELRGRVEVILFVSNYAHSKGGLWESIVIGKLDDLRRARENKMLLDLAVAGGIFMLGIYHVGLFLMRRWSWSNIIFGAFCLAIVVRIMVTGERPLFNLWPDFPWGLSVRAAFGSLLVSSILYASFMRTVFPELIGLLMLRVILAANALLLLPILVAPLEIYSRVLTPMSLLIVATGAWLWVVTFLAILRRDPDGWLAFPGLMCFLAAGLNDVFYSHLIINTGYYMQYGIFVFMLSQSLIISRRFARAYRRSEQLARDLNAINERLASLDRLKDEFLANTSHELRTPLQGIIGLAESLRRGVAEGQPHKHERNLSLIVASGRRLAGLVNDIQDFARLQNHDIILDPTALNIRELTSLALELGRSTLLGQDLELRNEVPEDFPPVWGEHDRVLQILQNLLANAIKFTESGRVTVTAAVGEHPGSGQRRMAAISVADTGIGIAGDRLDRIFESFEQAHGGSSRRYGGTGLGLSIVRSLVELHGGQISVRSRPNVGSTFTFSLPLAEGSAPSATAAPAQKSAGDDVPGRPATVRHETVLPESELTLAAARDAPVRDGSYSQNGAAQGEPRGVIFVVDDDPINLEVSADHLQLAGYEVRSFSSAVELLSALAASERRPNLIVLDLMMPEMNGYDTCRRIRENYSARSLPVLLLTARAQTKDFLDGINAGANDFITKPYDPGHFVRRVHNLAMLGHADETLAAALEEARKRFFRNVHDHIGGRLVDMKLLARELAQEERPRREVLADLDQQITDTMEHLRDAIRSSEEEALLRKDFVSGLRLVLMRRYQNAGRMVLFESDERFESALRQPGIDRLLSGLYAVITEIVTNDLKYGFGKAHWSFGWDEQLRVRLRTGSRFVIARNPTGFGTGNIISRVAELGGTVTSDLHDGEFVIAIAISIVKAVELV